jgi:hypothetical protein
VLQNLMQNKNSVYLQDMWNFQKLHPLSKFWWLIISQFYSPGCPGCFLVWPKYSPCLVDSFEILKQCSMTHNRCWHCYGGSGTKSF